MVSFVSREGQQRVDLTHSSARGKWFLFGALPSSRHPEVIALFSKPQSYADFKEAARATGRNVAFTDA
jgi:hypothetical protein